ncbi:hypothetical protein lerEdw1_004099 [Lerista edwardsae]|nr:hypothetical protein lerEdw1_004099 [Lerista edwardsae]
MSVSRAGDGGSAAEMDQLPVRKSSTVEFPVMQSVKLLKGWQPRYFVLENGILSYYDSQDDVGKGSKGSIKMAVCEIKVHATDPTRMELVIPGEQYFYLKAGGAAERQKWLVALGSSKACLGDSRSQKERDLDLNSESLGRKLSELRLYCDVLTQQVLAVQEATHPQDNGSPLDVQKMNEASSLLRATCSQFISTLEECMKFATTQLAPELYHPLVVPQPDFVGTKLPHTHRVRRSMSHTGIVSPDRALEAARAPPVPPKGTVTVLRNLEEMVVFRSQQCGQQSSQSGSPTGTIAEEAAGHLTMWNNGREMHSAVMLGHGYATYQGTQRQISSLPPEFSKRLIQWTGEAEKGGQVWLGKGQLCPTLSKWDMIASSFPKRKITSGQRKTLLRILLAVISDRNLELPQLLWTI